MTIRSGLGRLISFGISATAKKHEVVKDEGLPQAIDPPTADPREIADGLLDFRRFATEGYVDHICAFGSTVCREQHFRMPLYQYWCRMIKQSPRMHRKQWEFVYICQTLHERGLLASGMRGLGFGVGKEPLTALFASRGVEVLASDVDTARAITLGWATSGQHSNQLEDLNGTGLCDADTFGEKVRFRHIDMNHIPDDLSGFDFCWSSCAFEHLGSIRKGLDFVRNSLAPLRPGGVAVHTTEFNLSSNDGTLDNNDAFVLFRRRDFEELSLALEAEGHWLEPVDFNTGADPIERYVDLPPYIQEPHLRLLLGEYSSTSIGLIVHKALS